MNCSTCKHFRLREGNDLCTRTRTWATLKTTDTPVWTVLERREPDTWQGVNRRLEGDVCGPDAIHYKEIP